MTALKLVESIKDEGKKAFRNGKATMENPYQKDTAEWESWRRGWWESATNLSTLIAKKGNGDA